jgi:hypothetical protein
MKAVEGNRAVIAEYRSLLGETVSPEFGARGIASHCPVIDRGICRCPFRERDGSVATMRSKT